MLYCIFMATYTLKEYKQKKLIKEADKKLKLSNLSAALNANIITWDEYLKRYKLILIEFADE